MTIASLYCRRRPEPRANIRILSPNVVRGLEAKISSNCCTKLSLGMDAPLGTSIERPVIRVRFSPQLNPISLLIPGANPSRVVHIQARSVPTLQPTLCQPSLSQINVLIRIRRPYPGVGVTDPPFSCQVRRRVHFRGCPLLLRANNRARAVSFRPRQIESYSSQSQCWREWCSNDMEFNQFYQWFVGHINHSNSWIVWQDSVSRILLVLSRKPTCSFVAHVWVSGAKTTGPIAKKFVFSYL
jgi:hypothetical protein